MPDAFGFYRLSRRHRSPSTWDVLAARPLAFPRESVVLHALVIGVAFMVARLVYRRQSPRSSAVLAFALTPRGASERGALAVGPGRTVDGAVSRSRVWQHGSHGRAGGAMVVDVAAASYVLASAEQRRQSSAGASASSHPARRCHWPARCGERCLLRCLAMIVLWLRRGTGALMPFSTDEHYTSTCRYSGRPQPAQLRRAHVALRRSCFSCVRSPIADQKGRRRI